MQDLNGTLSVLAPFLLGLLTSYLSDKRSARHDNQSFLIADYQSVVNENEKLRRENERLREELHHDNN